VQKHRTLDALKGKGKPIRSCLLIMMFQQQISQTIQVIQQVTNFDLLMQRIVALLTWPPK